jgi:50S ribosomal protein L16 3-hydroxylase
MPLTSLNSLPVSRFMSSHWQKKPLLARGMLPDFAGLVPPQELMRLAQSDEAESRLVIRSGAHWHVKHGPFRKHDFRRPRSEKWTLLVQGVDRLLPRTRSLMSAFSFIPYARLDDLMVSYAPPGGGVGPHIDSYDVFLVQTQGVRHWEFSAQKKVALREGLPLRILENFRPSRNWSAHPGDVAYLPPRYAHHGVAVDECVTCSVGFRAPNAQELFDAFFDHLRDRTVPEWQYADPDLLPTVHPAKIPGTMQSALLRLLADARWHEAEAGQFLGCYLTTPKAQVLFHPPARPLPAAAFRNRVRRTGIALAAQTLMLYRGKDIFLNGECITAPYRSRPLLRRLADARQLDAENCKTDTLTELLYSWYRYGYVALVRG